jgi:hypothetical protein
VVENSLAQFLATVAAICLPHMTERELIFLFGLSAATAGGLGAAVQELRNAQAHDSDKSPIILGYDFRQPNLNNSTYFGMGYAFVAATAALFIALVLARGMGLPQLPPADGVGASMTAMIGSLFLGWPAASAFTRILARLDGRRAAWGWSPVPF